MSVAASVAALVDALEGAGIRVAVRSGEITPPVVLIHIGTISDSGVNLGGSATLTTFYAYYIPVRGVDNLMGDAEALDAIYAALDPIVWAPVSAAAASVTVKTDTWPCYRLDVSLAGAPVAANLRS